MRFLGIDFLSVPVGAGACGGGFGWKARQRVNQRGASLPGLGHFGSYGSVGQLPLSRSVKRFFVGSHSRLREWGSGLR